MNQTIDVVKRMIATFVATALGVVGSGAVVGVDVQKAALMAGVGAWAVVLERLSRAFLDDGKLSNEEINESDVVKNAATKHINKGLSGDSSVTKVESLPTSGGQSIKNAATKDINKGGGEKLKGEKSLEEPTKVNGAVKNAATKDIKNGKTEGPASQNIEKQPTSGGQSIKNAATKDMSKSGGTKLSTATPKVVSEDLDTNDGVNKMDEDNETIKNAATKDIKGGKTEVGGKTSGLTNMEEEKELGTELAMRAGAKGKVFESEMEEEGWMNEEEMGIDENAEARVAAEIAKRLGEMGIGGNIEAMTVGLEAAMANPSPEAEAKASELLGLPDAPVEQNPIFESEIPTTAELLAGLAGVITLFGVAYAITEKDKIVAALKKAFGKGDKTVKEYTDEHPISTDTAVKYMVTANPNVKSEGIENAPITKAELKSDKEKISAGVGKIANGVMDMLAKEDVEESADEKLNEAVNRIKQILKY